LISERLQQLIERLGWSQERLANEIVTSPSTVSRWLSGKMPPSKTSLRRIAGATGVNQEWLLTGQGQMLVPPAGNRAEPGPKLLEESAGSGRKPFLTARAFACTAQLTEDEDTFYGGLDGLFASITEWLEEERGADGLTALNFIMEFQERFPAMREWVKRKKARPDLDQVTEAPEKKSLAS